MNDELDKKMAELSECYSYAPHAIRRKIYELMEQYPKYRWSPYRSFRVKGSYEYDVILGSRDGAVWFRVFEEYDPWLRRHDWFINSWVRGPDDRLRLSFWDGGL